MGTVKYTGSMASFHCPTEATIRSLKVHFSPKQLGEGDPSPENVREIEGWDGVEVEQSGKNIWDEQWENGIYNVANGNKIDVPTALGRLRCKNLIPCLPNTQYLRVSVPRAHYFIFYDKDKMFITGSAINTAYHNPFTTPNNAYYMAFYTEDDIISYQNNISINYPATDTSYEPYHGETVDYEFGILGKNKVPWASPDGFTYTTTYNGNSNWSSPWLVPKNLNGEKITYSADIDNTNGAGNAYLHIWTQDEDNNFVDKNIVSNALEPGSSGRLSKTITLDTSRYSYVIFGLTMNNATASNPMVEIGDTATTYEPYDPNKTVYGGWVDLITGEVQEEWKYFNLQSNKISTNSGTDNFKYDDAFEDRKFTGSSYNFTCTAFPVRYISETGIPYIRWSSSTTTGLSFIKNDSSLELEDLQTLATNNQLSICYQLATPNTYSLAPTQLQTFLSHNNIWSNADYVEVEYDLHETQDILARKNFIIANQPHVVTPAAAPLQTFTTDVPALLKECKIYFNPMQEGSGDASPENVRAINGWDGIAYANLTDLNIAYVRDNLSSGQGINYICNTTSYPHNIKIIGTATNNFSTQFMRCDNAIKNKAYYIYNLPILDYNAWLCGIGTSISQVRADPNAFTAMGVNGYPIIASSSGQIRIYFQALQGKTYNLDFYPMISQIAPIKIDWQSRAGTIYGGYVDLVRGEVVQEWDSIDLGTIQWNATASGYAQSANAPYIKQPSAASVIANIFCNKYIPDTQNNVYSRKTDKTIAISIGTTTIRVYDTNLSNLTNAQYKDAMAGTQLVYQLVEPIHYAIDPITLKTFRGINNIWSNTNGDVQIKYWKH